MSGSDVRVKAAVDPGAPGRSRPGGHPREAGAPRRRGGRSRGPADRASRRPSSPPIPRRRSSDRSSAASPIPARARCSAASPTHCVEVPSPATERIGRAARKAKAWLCVGVSERTVDRDAPLHAAPLRPRRRAAPGPPQARAHPRRADGLGPRAGGGAPGGSHRVRAGGAARLLGELHAAGALLALRVGRAHPPGAHRRRQRRLAGDAPPHRPRGPRLRPGLQPVRHPRRTTRTTSS